MSDDKPVLVVDFAFRRELAKKVEGNLASFCYQCGACAGDCPAAAYDPRFNPRRIMLQVLYGDAESLLGAGSPLWLCTNCYSCHERCPQQVKPVEVVIALKNMLHDRGLQPQAVDRVIRQFGETGRTTPVTPAVERQREALGLPPLRPVPVEEVHALLGEEVPARAPRSPRLDPLPPAEGRRFAFFPGCLIPTRLPAMEYAIRETLARLGVEVADLPGASCCPDPIYFKSRDKADWLAVAARNLCLAEDLGLDVFTNCSGCTATLSETWHLLQDPALRAHANARLARIGRTWQGTSRVRHVVTLLRDVVGYEAIRASVVRPLTGLKVAIHYGCHLLKPSAVMQVDDPDDPHVLEDLVRALGATPVRHRNWYLCCGKACQDEDLPSRMMRDLLGAVHDEEADLLCLICPTCFGQFDYGQARVAKQFEADFHMPVVYLFQLLAFAEGIPYERLGFDRQKFKPDALRRYESAGP